MANYKSANVIVVDTSAAFSEVLNVKSVKYIGNTGGSASIKGNADSSGPVLWECDGDADAVNEVCIRDNKGLYVSVASGAKVYLYLK